MHYKKKTTIWRKLLSHLMTPYKLFFSTKYVIPYLFKFTFGGTGRPDSNLLKHYELSHSADNGMIVVSRRSVDSECWMGLPKPNVRLG